MKSVASAYTEVDVEYGKDACVSNTSCDGGGGSTVPPSVIVRKGTEVPIDWNVGTSDPANCVLRAGNVVIAGPFSRDSGTTNFTAIGETVITLDCEDGNNVSSMLIRVLPDIQET